MLVRRRTDAHRFARRSPIRRNCGAFTATCGQVRCDSTATTPPGPRDEMPHGVGERLALDVAAEDDAPIVDPDLDRRRRDPVRVTTTSWRISRSISSSERANARTRSDRDTTPTRRPFFTTRSRLTSRSIMTRRVRDRRVLADRDRRRRHRLAGRARLLFRVVGRGEQPGRGCARRLALLLPEDVRLGHDTEERVADATTGRRRSRARRVAGDVLSGVCGPTVTTSWVARSATFKGPNRDQLVSGHIRDARLRLRVSRSHCNQ